MMNEALIATEHLPLTLSLPGFSQTQTLKLDQWLSDVCHTDTLGIQWKLTHHSHDADACLFNMAMTAEQRRCYSSSGLQVTRAMLMPEPAASHAQWREAHTQFLRSLGELEAAVQPHAMRYALGREIVQLHLREERLSKTWQLMAKDRMIAMVDFNRKRVYLRPDGHSIEMGDAYWVHRPFDMAAPEQFVSLPLERVLWDYSRRSTYEVLPRAYLERTLHLRRYPRLPLSSMNMREIAVINALREHSATHAELVARLAYSREEIAHVLGQLWLSGAISTRKLSWLENTLAWLQHNGLRRHQLNHVDELPSSTLPAPEKISMFLNEPAIASAGAAQRGS